MRTYKNRMNSSALSDMNEKEANVLLAQMESADEELFLLRKTYKEPKRSATRSKDYKTC
jgi:hypothetical protein